ncbi:MAG: hypothetical protein DME18_15465 [Verrucomicrobia bacterium]|nr:MAG: hypothetical protein DME18_15465 [Verrucomicrobiota bacterium]
MARSLLLKDSRAETSYLTRLPMKITEALLAEHVVFHNLFDHVERTASKLKSVAEVKSLANLIESLLKAHSEVEEELLVEPLDHCLEQIGHRETFHQEHQEIDDNLERAQTARSLKQARACLLTAVVSSRKHFDKEERIVFPLAEKVLKSRTLTDLWNTWTEQRNRTIG